MFNCVYADGEVITTEDIGECVDTHPVTGAVLLDISELSTTVDVTTEEPAPTGLVLAGLGLLLLLAMSSGGRRKHAGTLL